MRGRNRWGSACVLARMIPRLLASLACMASPNACRPRAAPAAATAPNLLQTFALASGHTARVEGERITLLAPDGTQLADNPRLARTQDEHGTCPSDGFQSISSSGQSFVIEQQTCSGWHFIHERLVFRYDDDIAGFVLQAFTRQYLDRRTAADGDLVRLAPEHFGVLRFEHTELARLYVLEPRTSP